MRRFLRQTFVIARRDFTAIVLTPTFLIFLLAPLFMLGVATIGGLGAARIVEGGRERTVILAGPDDIAVLRQAEQRLRYVSGTEPGPPPVSYEAPHADPERQARTLVAGGAVSAVLFERAGGLVVLHPPGGARDGDYLALIATAAASDAPPAIEAIADERPRASRRERSAAAFGTVFAMFFLTLLLAGQSISMLAEERSNKVIEILAAAVPLESVFLGKLVGMLGVAILFILFWGGVAGGFFASGVGGVRLDGIVPVTSLPAFAALFLGYFMLAFLLLSAVFLGIGAQAGSPRELQMLSLPVTIFQVAMFAWASAAAGDPDGAVGVSAAIFPFSSPFAMAARAASGAPAWQHVAAFAWQALWLGITVTIAARLFRRGVLKSGGVRG